MSRWHAFILFMVFLFALVAWWTCGPIYGIAAVALTAGLAVLIVWAERTDERGEAELRKDIEATGYPWEFFQEWRASEEEIERRERRRAVKNAMRRFWSTILRSLSISLWSFRPSSRGRSNPAGRL
ncbi:MAG: hypothetical protein ABSH56_00040 [Bryobacteraceae bacterium]|jgi:hypothetical protein